MSVDSIGGGDARDPNLAMRRRMLEEERARELETIDKRYKEEVEKTQEARELSLRNMFEAQAGEIEEKQADSDRRVNIVKAAADERIRAFQDEATRMTDNARRQFLQKADLLQKNADEFEAQRGFLIKQHNDSMRQMKEEREGAQWENNQRMAVEANKSYLEQKRKLNDLQYRGEAELTELGREIQDEKLHKTGEASRELSRLEDEREHQKAQIQHEIDFNARQGDGQLARKRASLESQRVHLENQLDEVLARKGRENAREINRVHIMGRNQVDDAAHLYEGQAKEIEKASRARVRDTQAHGARTIAQMESDGKAQETIAQKGYEFRKQILHEGRERMLADHAAKSAAMQEKAARDYGARSLEIWDQQKKLLGEQTERAQKEVRYQLENGQRQISDTVRRNAERVGDHESKASSDPFYRLQALNARVRDGDEALVVEIEAPEHEQSAIRLTQQQGVLTLSGTRRASSAARSDEGRRVTTNSFQSYSETVPVTSREKLDMKRMSRLYSDGRVTFRIPKG